MSSAPSQVEHGYLVLADIAGYTSFLSKTELDHSNEILTDLLETILQRFKTLLTIHKIEGDAVFAYAPEARIIRGETLLELIETTYMEFRERMKNVRRHTTCTCRACQSIPMLDLKFMTHYGEFAFQSIGGRPELAGSDVNLAHRLMKNHVVEKTGWRAYMLFTQAALGHMGLQLEGLVESIESYEHLGETRVFSMDLHPRYEALLKRRRVVVEPAEAVYTFSEILNAPPPHVWSWLNEPGKRSLYTAGPGALEFLPMLRPGGRTGAGATTHCVHGDDISMRETVLDWKPFDYFTVEQVLNPMLTLRITNRLEPIEGNQTRLTVHLAGRMQKMPSFLSQALLKLVFGRFFNYGDFMRKAKELMEQEEVTSMPEPAAN